MVPQTPQLIANAVRRAGAALVVVAGSALGGCSAFNPQFISLFAEEGSPALAATIENVPGHIPFLFVNRARFDPLLVEYMRGVGIPVDDPTLRPRLRFRVMMTFVNGNTSTFEIIDGSSVIEAQAPISPDQAEAQEAVLPTDLTRNELTNVVAVCDVARVEVVGDIEVFVPVFIKTVQIQQGDLGPPTIEFVDIQSPQFVPLQVDDVDADGNITLQRNIGIRDVPPPALDLLCGTVVTGVFDGVLSVPFVIDENGNSVPGFLDTAVTSQALVPGRFKYTASTR